MLYWSMLYCIVIHSLLKKCIAIKLDYEVPLRNVEESVSLKVQYNIGEYILNLFIDFSTYLKTYAY